MNEILKILLGVEKYHRQLLIFIPIMDCTSTRIPYRQTGVFSKIVIDYIDQAEALKPFVAHQPIPEGIKHAISARKSIPVNRKLLVDELSTQYNDIETSGAVQKNINALLSPDTFTITTAHQNNIFTGPLYFIYKILHAIKLSEHLNTQLVPYKFVPVYYIGSEDADLDELNHIYLNGEKLVWNTMQTGAVGRMKIDNDFLKLISAIEGQLGVFPFGKETVSLIKDCYRPDEDIQMATFRMVNALFSEYGLIILLPDNAKLKEQLLPVFEDDLLNQTASKLVEKTSAKLGESYKVQVHPREINLFYLLDNIRERIVLRDTKYQVLNTGISFSKEELMTELKNHPERFSPNVILRGLYQVFIMPDIVFIGGGGELAYWLELKDMFNHYQVPYPVQLVRNSFLIIEDKWRKKMDKLGLSIEEIFQSEQELINLLVSRHSDKKTELNGTLSATEQIYEEIKKQAVSIDVTLEKHVDSLKSSTMHRLKELEKKMLRAEKRKFSDQQRQIHILKEKLFPEKGLQERYDNMLYYYAILGSSFIQKVYEHSLTLEQEFVVLEMKE
ncbi:MAG: bacillithiol biosynthesis cysteine-adding enzyme BshC [Chitinophagaceae bacterium]